MKSSPTAKRQRETSPAIQARDVDGSFRRRAGNGRAWSPRFSAQPGPISTAPGATHDRRRSGGRDVGCGDVVNGVNSNLRFGVAVWSIGTVSELVLLGFLAREAFSRRDARNVGRLAAPLAIERAVVHGLGPLLDRDRPRRRLQRPAFVSPSSSSMPSGHASNSFLAATLLSSTQPTGLVFTLATVASTSRAVLRVHRVTEVASSAAIGVVVGLAMNRMVRPSDDGGPRAFASST